MTRSFTMLITALLFSAGAYAAITGEPAPHFTGTDIISGKPLSNETLKGKTVVLEWNNFGCPFVHKFYDSGTMQKLQANAVSDGVVWVTVNSSAVGKQGYLADSAEAKAAIAEHHGKQSAYILDHEGMIGHAFGAKATPHMYIINTDGVLVYQGAIDDQPTPDKATLANATNYIVEALKSLKAGTPIKVATTQPYGCYVKY